jgi:hypothetical protein
VRLSVVQVLFVAWLLAATSSAVWLTVPVFAAMLALTLAALRRVLAAERAPGAAVPDAAVTAARAAQGRGDRVVRWLLGGTLGVYAGWSTAAVWVNAASVLPPAGMSTTGLTGTAWQAVFLFAATAAAAVVVRALAAPLPYTATVAWAFAGVVVSSLMASSPGFAAVAAAGLLVVVAVAVAARGSTPPATAT